MLTHIKIFGFSLILSACASQPTLQSPPPPPQSSPQSSVEEPGKIAEAAVPTPEPHVSWAYQGEAGPQNWGNLKAEYGLCGKGQTQSPVDLKWQKPIPGGEMKFDYRPSHLRLLDTGHSLQLNVDGGSRVMVRGQEYDLVQMHFHSPSEHTLSGQSLPIEWHLVHRNGQGNLAVLAVFMIEGKKSSWLEQILDVLPPVKGHELEVKDRIFSPLEVLPKRFTYYHYEGSLTTPPCAEDVNWNVFNTPITADRTQIEKLRELYDHNNRPIQSIGGRKVINY